MDVILKGTARKFGDDINADQACQFYKNMEIDLEDTERLASICMSGYDPHFYQKAKRGDIIVAGKNFASGHMHAHFYLSLKALGIGAVLAETMNRRFYREAINRGLPVMICPSTQGVHEGDEIELDLRKGEIRMLKSGLIIEGEILSPILLDILGKGGLEGYLKGRCY
jgi:3-isopropylmalate/(R)-2-methylmalate dehydratase small subunit